MEEFVEVTIKVKKSDIEMITAFLDQCDGEVLATKRRKRNARGILVEVERSTTSQPVPEDVPSEGDMEAGSADASSSNGKRSIV